MFKMSRQDTRRQVRLNKLMESRIPGDRYVRFGGEFLETYHGKTWQGAGFLSYAYTTEEREKLRVMDYAERYGGMEKGIATLAAEIRNRDGPVKA